MEDLHLTSRVLLVILLGTVIALVTNWASNRAVPGLKSFFVSYLVCAAAIAISPFGVIEGVFWVNVVAPTLLLATYVCLWNGFLGFFYKPRLMTAVLGGAMLLLAALVLSYFTYVYDNYLLRVGFIRGLATIGSFLILRTIWVNRREDDGIQGSNDLATVVGSMMAFGIFLFHMLSNAVRFMDLMFSVHIWPSEEALRVAYLSEVTIFALLLSFAVVIMANERLQTEVRLNRLLDPLTGACNRRPFSVIARSLMGHAKRKGEPVSFVYVVLENLYDIRRTMGAQVEESALRAFANAVMLGRRAQDVCCAYQKGQFLLMLPDTGKQGANRVAQDIEYRCRNMDSSKIFIDGVVKLHPRVGVTAGYGDELDLQFMIDRCILDMEDSGTKGARPLAKVRALDTKPQARQARQANQANLESTLELADTAPTAPASLESGELIFSPQRSIPQRD